MSVYEEIVDLKARVSKAIVGQEDIVEKLIIGLLSNGNLLVEGLPGLAKTRAIKSLSDNLEADFNRIQFTPDLVSSDITGKEVYYGGTENEKGAFKFIPGPIFSNIVLADEINRAPSKVQNSLLEAMEERQVTVAAVTHKVPDLFMVMATQNPSSQEGTYALPEAQMDRFLMHLTVDYPDEEAEAHIIRMVRDEQKQGQKSEKGDKPKKEKKKTKQETIFAARAEIDEIEVPEEVEKFMVDLIFATRYPQRYSFELKSYIALGASPRGSLALDKCVRADTWMRGQKTAEIENVTSIVKYVLRHRIAKSERSEKHNVVTDELIDDILKFVKP